MHRHILNDENLAEWQDRQPKRKKKIRMRFLKTFESSFVWAIKRVGLYKRGCRNALDLQVRQREFIFSNLPKEFHGIKILFMSDLHLGGTAELPQIILDKINSIDVDICLLGGDYRWSYFYPNKPFFSDLQKVLTKIRAPLGVYGVLGNHDELAFVPALEEMGVRVLCNDSVAIRARGGQIHLAGIDEAVHFKRHDAKRTFCAIPDDAFTLCLSHSPHLYREAEEHGADLYLCGHTHQGQIRLPWLGPVVTLAPRKYSTGLWKYKKMVGYTASGVGTGAAGIRFRCPPEITVLTLKSSGH